MAAWMFWMDVLPKGELLTEKGNNDGRRPNFDLETNYLTGNRGVGKVITAPGNCLQYRPSPKVCRFSANGSVDDACSGWSSDAKTTTKRYLHGKMQRCFVVDLLAWLARI